MVLFSFPVAHSRCGCVVGSTCHCGVLPAGGTLLGDPVQILRLDVEGKLVMAACLFFLSLAFPFRLSSHHHHLLLLGVNIIPLLIFLSLPSSSPSQPSSSSSLLPLLPAPHFWLPLSLILSLPISSCVSFIHRLLHHILLLHVEVVIRKQVSGTERRGSPRSASQTTRELETLVRMVPAAVTATMASRGGSQTPEQREDDFSRAASAARTGGFCLPLPIR